MKTTSESTKDGMVQVYQQSQIEDLLNLQKMQKFIKEESVKELKISKDLFSGLKENIYKGFEVEKAEVKENFQKLSENLISEQEKFKRSIEEKLDLESFKEEMLSELKGIFVGEIECFKNVASKERCEEMLKTEKFEAEAKERIIENMKENNREEAAKFQSVIRNLQIQCNVDTNVKEIEVEEKFWTKRSHVKMNLPLLGFILSFLTILFLGSGLFLGRERFYN